MKKLFVLTAVIFLIIFAFSSCGRRGVCGLGADIYIQKENGELFKPEELKTFYVSGNGTMSLKNSNITDIGSNMQKDDKGIHYLLLSFRLGTANTEAQMKKLAEEYAKKLKDFYFSIEDKSGVYETFTMKPLSNDHEKQDSILSHWARIKYTIKLKKK